MPVFLSELKTQLNIGADRTELDVDLQAVLDAAVEVVEGVVGPLSPTTVTRSVTFSDGRAVLPDWPIVDFTTAGLTLEPGGVVSGLYGTQDVTYTYGRTEPTAAQRRAVLLVAHDLWETRRGQGYAQADGGEYVDSPILRRRVRELLAPTRLGPSVA